MSKKSIKTVLLVEDNPGDARLLREMLQEEGLYSSELLHADSMADAEKFLAEHAVDIILLDLGRPMRKDWKRCGGRTQLRPASRWWS